DSNALIIKAEGNENLTIDSIYYFSGDTNSFTINYNQFKNYLLNVDSSVSVPIQFHPTVLGQHELILEVLNDAAPNYQREKAYIKIQGFCIEEDTVDADISIADLGSPVACQFRYLKVNLENKGNKPLLLQQLNLDAGGLNARWSVNPMVPYVLNPDSSVQNEITIFAKKYETGTIRVEAIFNDTLVKKTEFVVRTITNKLTIDKIEDISVIPGDTIIITLSGKIPNSVDSAVSLDFNMELDMKNLYCLDQFVPLSIKNVVENMTIPLKIYQTKNKISLVGESKIKISDPSEWLMELRFLGLLSDVKEFKILVINEPDDCFEIDSTEFSAKISNVCMLPIRLITFGDPIIPEIKIFPVPAGDYLKIEVFMPIDDKINITIFDNFGKICKDSLNLYLKKGKHSLIFEINHFADGIYFLSFENSQLRKNLIFIKTK
ncbi:MAG: T9SS type A sorting domain-containing protein, partial [Bacteroidota bacterium]